MAGVCVRGGRATGATPSGKFVDEQRLQSEIRVWNLETRTTSLTLTGHTGSILSLAASPDGKRLVTSSADAKVKVWELATGKLEADLAGVKGLVFAVAFSPNGQAVALGGGDPRGESELKLWDVASRKERMSYKGHEGPVFAVAFAPDGKTVASGGLDQTVRFWNVANGDELRSIRGHKAPIWSVAYDPAGQRITSASWDETVKVWDATSPQGFQLLTNVASYSTCFSPDGRFLVMSGGRGLEVVELGASSAPFVVPDYKANDLVVAIAPDGSVLASAGDDQKITLWEVGTWRRIGVLKGHLAKIWHLAFAPDSRTLASEDGESVRFWDVAQRAQRAIFYIGAGGKVLFTPDGRTLIMCGPERVVFLDATTATEQRSIAGIVCHYGAMSPDGGCLAGRLPNSALGLVELKTGELRWRSQPHRADLWAVSYSPDGKTLATASWDGTAKLINAGGGQEMFTYKAPGVVWSANFSPDGKWLAVGSGSTQKGQTALFRSATASEVLVADSPAILVHPVSQTATEGSSARLDVVATGAEPMFYQWRHGSRSLPGQTRPSLTLSNVTAASAGDYSAIVSNMLGSVTSSNGSLSVLQVREVPIAEVNFEDKQPSAGYDAQTYSQQPVTLTAKIAETAGRGVDGSTGLVVKADRYGFTNAPRQEWSGFGASVGVLASRADGVNTPNLNAYRLYVTARVAGLASPSSHGRIQWQFLTPQGPILSINLLTAFTTNYQTYSFVLSDGSIDPNSGGSWTEFAADFDQVNRVQCVVWADRWLTEFSPNADNELLIGHVKFVRLVPVSSSAADSPTIRVDPAGQTVTEGSSARLNVVAGGADPLFYQWRRGTNGLSGQTRPTLTLSNVTAASVGDYSVIVSNQLGRATSSSATISILAMREAPIAEVNFEDKPPSAGYSAYTFVQNPLRLLTCVTQMAGMGVGGRTGLVMTADGSAFTNDLNQGWAGFGVIVGALANSNSGVSTTNLNLYKLYATVKTAGLIAPVSHGFLQWQFVTPDSIILSVDCPAVWTANYQEYSFVLGNGSFSRYSGGSWDQFVANFDKIDRVRCAVSTDRWLGEYGPDADNAFYIGRIKFVRLVPFAPPPVDATRRDGTPQAEAAAH